MEEKNCLKNASMEHIEALHAALAEVILDVKKHVSEEESLKDESFCNMLDLYYVINNYKMELNNK